MTRAPFRKTVAAIAALLVALIAAPGSSAAGSAPGRAVAAAPEALKSRAHSVLGEVDPSRKLKSSVAINALGFEDKSRFTRAVMDTVPLSEVARLFGFDADTFRWEYGTGGYDRAFVPNLIATVTPRDGRMSEEELQRLRAFAQAWMYVYRQDSVPWYGPSSRAGQRAGEGPLGIRFVFERELTPARERTLFAALIAVVGSSAGYTRTAANEIVVLNFHDGDTTLLHPGLSHAESNARFAVAMREFAGLVASASRVAAAEYFGAYSESPRHDWKVDPAGAMLLAAIEKAFPQPQVQARLRDFRASYERLVAEWAASAGMAVATGARAVPLHIAGLRPHWTAVGARIGAGREETPEIVFAAAATALRQPAVARDGALR